MTATAPPGEVLVVDVRNVVGARPDGWWRDPEGACADLDAADDRIVALLRDEEVSRQATVTVVTADRGLRDRISEVRDDVTCVGPMWLRSRIDTPD